MGDKSGANTQGSQGEMKMSVRLEALLIMPHPFYFILVSIPEIFIVYKLVMRGDVTRPRVTAGCK